MLVEELVTLQVVREMTSGRLRQQNVVGVFFLGQNVLSLMARRWCGDVVALPWQRQRQTRPTHSDLFNLITHLHSRVVTLTYYNLESKTRQGCGQTQQAFDTSYYTTVYNTNTIVYYVKPKCKSVAFLRREATYVIAIILCVSF